MNILVILNVVNLFLLIFGILLLVRVLKVKDNRFTNLNLEVFKIWKTIGRKSLSFGDYLDEKKSVTRKLFGGDNRDRIFVLKLIATDERLHVLKTEEWLALHQTLDTNCKIVLMIECSSDNKMNSVLYDILVNLEAISNFGIPIYLVINRAAYGFSYSLARYSRKVYATPGSEVDMFGLRDVGENGAKRAMSDAVLAGEHLINDSNIQLQRIKGDALLDLGVINRFGSLNEILKDSVGSGDVYLLECTSE